jgi:hypothetical protein
MNCNLQRVVLVALNITQGMMLTFNGIFCKEPSMASFVNPIWVMLTLNGILVENDSYCWVVPQDDRSTFSLALRDYIHRGFWHYAKISLLGIEV